MCSTVFGFEELNEFIFVLGAEKTICVEMLRNKMKSATLLPALMVDLIALVTAVLNGKPAED